MSTEKEVKAKEKFDEIKAKMTKLAKENPSGQSAVERRLILGGINALKKLITSGASNNLKEKIRNLKEKLENEKIYKLAKDRKPSGRLNLDDIKRASTKKTQKPDITKRAMGGSMGGGMNPMGYSKDPTIRSVTGYNPNRPNMRSKGGAIKRRGGGIAKRGMGIAK